tara:strand:+ start:54 stop:560 length:507 start_codon:yes stop_codon:yes gene_type:complete
VLGKNTFNILSKSNNLVMQYIRTPTIIWNNYLTNYNFTVDACASDKNHLVDKYWTEENCALEKKWDGEIVYCHPMYDLNIPKFVSKAVESKCKTVFLLPASTNSRYFHKYFWDSQTLKLRSNINIQFLPAKKGGYKFCTEDNIEPKVGYLRPLMIVEVNNIGGSYGTK